METIVICVCTCQRPQMLSRCLSSLLHQELLPDWQVVYVVVDNEREPNNEDLVKSFTTKTPHQISYVHQPQRGIAFARNAALNKALEYKPNWICFFDDDQYAKNDAILSAYTSATQLQADVISMKVNYILHNTAFINLKKSYPGNGKMIKACGTGGVFFRSLLIEPNGFNLQFNESCALSGGEDVDFFYRSYMLGAKIFVSNDAVVYEDILPEHTTFQYLCATKFARTITKLQLARSQASPRMFIVYILLAGVKLLSGMLEATLLPLYLCCGWTFFKYKFIKIIRRFLIFFGVIGYFLGMKGEPYAKIIGS